MSIFEKVIQTINKRLSIKFILFTSLTIFMVLFIGNKIIENNQRTKIEHDLHEKGQSMATIISAVSKEFILGYNMQMLEKIVTDLKHQNDIVWAGFFDTEDNALTMGQVDFDTTQTILFKSDVLSDGEKIGKLTLLIKPFQT